MGATLHRLTTSVTKQYNLVYYGQIGGDALRLGRMTYGHLRADCLYTGISSGPNARYGVSEAFTLFTVPQRGSGAELLVRESAGEASS